MHIGFFTNNVAELLAIRQGLLIAWELSYKFINLQIDYEIVICWLISNGTIAPLIVDCKILLSRARTVLPYHFFREANNIADGIAKK